MPKRTLTLLLLAAFCLGFAVGPHPCEAGHEEERESRPSSCHETPGSSDSGSAPQEDGQGCCDTVCRHACHMPAVSGMNPAAFAVRLVSQVAVQGCDRVLPPLAHPIDHVPLA